MGQICNRVGHGRRKDSFLKLSLFGISLKTLLRVFALRLTREDAWNAAKMQIVQCFVSNLDAYFEKTFYRVKIFFKEDGKLNFGHFS